MSDFDLIICGGTGAASDTFKADVGIRGGRIVALADGLTGATQTIDAKECLVLPGSIDSHATSPSLQVPASSWPRISRTPPARLH
jgi:dihydropyrimidinase